MITQGKFELIEIKNDIATYRCQCGHLFKLKSDETHLKCFKCLLSGSTKNMTGTSMITASDMKFAEFTPSKADYKSFVRYVPKKNHPFKNIGKRKKTGCQVTYQEK